MRLDPEQLTELLAPIESEGNPRLILAPTLGLPGGQLLPHVWRELLAREDAHKQAASLLWGRGAHLLPRVVATIQEKLQAIGLLITDLRMPSLVYIFTRQEEIFARRGYMPSDSLPAVSNKLSIDLSPFYRIHNGWVDFFSGDTGLLPVEEWQVLAGSQLGSQEGFLEVFTAGGSGMGFDLSQQSAGSYIIWSDEQVVPVDHFWARLDSWISDDLREMDRNTE